MTISSMTRDALIIVSCMSGAFIEQMAIDASSAAWTCSHWLSVMVYVSLIALPLFRRLHGIVSQPPPTHTALNPTDMAVNDA